ncbi:pth11-like integral membrane protein [Dactylonectria estremocensis]|uniref:Pth11-like integral membrane protein n=1 Tax=Dactylonectria estremocensis TaxID=1079267 RepID=A0A9P9DZC4_9HYPO|nr:pth11-like integral membrane protein [Dactylonectria estremocensis]
MAEPNPVMVQIFGEAPEGLDLTQSTATADTAVTISLLALAVIAIILRFVARRLQQAGLKMDDWAIILALLFVGGTVGISIAGAQIGSGKHVWVVDLDNLTLIFKLLYAYTYVYASACAMTKISILFFYLRIFTNGDVLFKLSMGLGFFLSISYPFIIWITMANCCKPVSFYWLQFTGATGTCIDVNKFFLALGIINMLADVIVLIIPIPQILKLQMSRKKKAGVSGIMLLGSFVCVASIVRIHYLSKFSSTTDLTYAMGPVFIWSAIEPCIAIVSACLPHLVPLRHVVRSKLESSFGSKNGQSNSSTPWRSHPSVVGKNSQKSDTLFTYGGSRFNFGGDRMLKLVDTDDEIALTNRVTSGSSTHKSNPSPSSASGSDDVRNGHSIMVQSTIMQSSTTAKS